MGKADEDAYYVATAIPYVNGAPHVGHALEAIIGDVLARKAKRDGYKVFYSYGTDEHGGKIMDKAAVSGVNTQEYVDKVAASFKKLAEDLQIDYTRFIRTTDEKHEQVAAQIWKRLEEDIYTGSYIGMYDQREESFINDNEVADIKANDPERFERLEKLEEKNYFFKLSKYTGQIKQLIETDEIRVIPQSRKNEILHVLEQGLEDISISRPKEKIPWGIPVPGDANQTMYVWFEALMNYITTLNYPDGDDFKTFWPCDAHVIGKDILRFHAAIWPAMLLALGESLPKEIYVHGFITMDGQKMSKSVGNVVSPQEIIDGYGSDALRYYFLRHVSSHGDGDFGWEKFEAAYNGELGNELGNLVQRVASMIDRYQDGEIGEIPPSNHDVGQYNAALDDYRFDKALEYVWELIRGLNQYIDTEAPWQLAKDEDEKEHLQEVLAYATSSILQFADLLGPFLPTSSAKIIKIFGTGTVKNEDGPLFPRINNYT